MYVKREMHEFQKVRISAATVRERFPSELSHGRGSVTLSAL